MERKGEGVCSSCCHANEGGALAMLTNSSSHGWTHHLLMLPPPFPSLYPFISPLLSPGFSFLNTRSLTRLLLLGSVRSRDSSWVGGAVVACGAACKAASVCCACTSFTRGKNGFKWCRWIRGGSAELMRNWVSGLGYRQQRSSTHLSGHQGSVFFLFFFFLGGALFTELMLRNVRVKVFIVKVCLPEFRLNGPQAFGITKPASVCVFITPWNQNDNQAHFSYVSFNILSLCLHVCSLHHFSLVWLLSLRIASSSLWPICRP